MAKRIIFSVIAVFIIWTLLEMLLHGVLLKSTYQATAALWRPDAEMKMGVMNLSRFLSAFFFVLIYALLIKDKSLKQALKFGLLFGLSVGISSSYGMYAVMPIPYYLAFAWFTGNVIIILAGAGTVGLIVKSSSGGGEA